jgi:SAM-dependent methyltransferase
MHADSRPPAIVDLEADARFRALALARGLRPDDRFVGGYVAWEWAHARHLFQAAPTPIAEARVLELGCNVGATAIVLGALGAEVMAVDPDPGWVEIARANVARHGLSARVTVLHVPDTTVLPFPDGAFSWASCNSVLEYVAHEALGGVLSEIGRVLAPGGVLAILGTSNQLWPREQHSGRWLVGWLPRVVDRWRSAPPPRRGLTRRRVSRALEGWDDLLSSDGGLLFVEMKRRMGARGLRLAALRSAARLATGSGVSPGALGPTLTMLLQKPGEPAHLSTRAGPC